MQHLTRVVVIALLGWRAVAWGMDRVRYVANPPAAARDAALSASSDERIARVLGADTVIFRALRDSVPAGATVFGRQVQGSLEELQRTTGSERELIAAFERLSARNGLLIQLTTLSFPEPFFVCVTDPIALVESEVAAGRAPWLFVLDGDPEPTGRAGWNCVRSEPRFRLWRFQRA